MKRFFCAALVLMLVLSPMVGCERAADDGRVEIVCTVFPIYDWVDNLLGEGDDVALRLLVNRGTDPHSYTPTPTDIAAIHASDVLIYVGGESDAWVSDVLKTVKNEDIKIISLLGLLGDRAHTEETVEGMQCEGEDCHDHEHEESEEHGAYDEHVWLSVKNAEMLCDELAEELADVLPDMEEEIEANRSVYTDRLSALDARFEETVAAASGNLLIFADRFPFRYLIEDYSLDYFAAFSGCSADSEASFETVVFLSDKLKDSGAHALIILESSTKDLANTVISNSGCNEAQIVVMDSMQSITARDVDGGASYLSIMEKNLAALSAALG